MSNVISSYPMMVLNEFFRLSFSEQINWGVTLTRPFKFVCGYCFNRNMGVFMAVESNVFFQLRYILRYSHFSRVSGNLTSFGFGKLKLVVSVEGFFSL